MLSRLLPELLYTILEWLMHSARLQRLLFGEGEQMDDERQTVYANDQHVARRAKKRLFSFLHASLTCLEGTERAVMNVYDRAHSLQHKSTPLVSRPNMVHPSLPSVYESFASNVREAADVVLRHLLNRLHQFPMRAADGLWHAEDDEGDLSEGEADGDGEEGSGEKNLGCDVCTEQEQPIRDALYGQVVSSVSEENDPPLVPPCATSLRCWDVDMQVNIDGEVAVNVQHRRNGETMRTKSSGRTSSRDGDDEDDDIPTHHSATVTASSPPACLHYMYDRALVTALERAIWTDDSFTTSTTHIRIIIRDLTGKYVYDFQPVEQMNDAIDANTLITASSSIIKQAFVLDPTLLHDALLKQQQQRFQQLERQWSHVAMNGQSSDVATSSTPATSVDGQKDGEGEESWTDPLMLQTRNRRGLESAALRLPPAAFVRTTTPAAPPKQPSNVVDTNEEESARARASQVENTEANVDTDANAETDDTSADDGADSAGTSSTLDDLLAEEDAQLDDGLEPGLSLFPPDDDNDTEPDPDADAAADTDTDVDAAGQWMVTTPSSTQTVAAPAASEITPLQLPASPVQNQRDKCRETQSTASTSSLVIHPSHDPLQQVLNYVETSFGSTGLLSTSVRHADEELSNRTGAHSTRVPSLSQSLSNSAMIPKSPRPAQQSISHRTRFSPRASVIHHSPNLSFRPCDSDDEGQGSVLFMDMSTLNIDEHTFSHSSKNTGAGTGRSRTGATVSEQHNMETAPNRTVSVLAYDKPAVGRAPALPKHRYPVSSFDYCRALVSRLYVGLDSLASNCNPSSSLTSIVPQLVPLEDSTKLRLTLKLLDKNPCRECHKIGIVYVGPYQDSQRAILCNDRGSPLYESFLSRLGRLVDVGRHAGFIGGLDARQTGKTSIYWCSATTELMWHVVTRMPTNRLEGEEQQIHKKKHLGNDHVQVVWCEFGRDYRPSTISSQFNDVHIVIYPLVSTAANSALHGLDPSHHDATSSSHSSSSSSSSSSALDSCLYRVQILRKSHVRPFGPLQDGMVLRGSVLAPLVRLTALNANRSVRYAQATFVRPMPTRRRYIEEMAEKFCKEEQTLTADKHKDATGIAAAAAAAGRTEKEWAKLIMPMLATLNPSA